MFRPALSLLLLFVCARSQSCIPAAPGSVAVSASDSTLSVSWSPSLFATNYTIFASVPTNTSSPFSVFGACSQPRNLSQTVSGVHLFRVSLPAVNGVAYTVRVSAAGACGAGPPSAPVLVTVAPPSSVDDDDEPPELID